MSTSSNLTGNLYDGSTYSGNMNNSLPFEWTDDIYTRFTNPIVSVPMFAREGQNYSFQRINYISQPPIDFELYLSDAVRRYKELHANSEPDVKGAESFLHVFKVFVSEFSIIPYIMFNKFCVKVDITFNNKKLLLDYDYDDPGIICILYKENGTLIVKETTLEKLEESIKAI